MANEKFYLDLDGLKAYNTKIKKFITDNSLTEADVTTLITNNTKTLSTQVGTNTAAIATIVGEDASKSMRTVASEEVAKIVAGADKDFDTLKEIAEWIQNHPNDVATINKNIQNLKALIGTIPESSKADNIVDYVQECVNSLRDEFYSYLTTITQSGKTLTITGPNVKEENKTLNIKGRII